MERKEYFNEYDRQFELAPKRAKYVNYEMTEIGEGIYDIDGEKRKINWLDGLKEHQNFRKNKAGYRGARLISNHYTSNIIDINDGIERWWGDREASAHFVVDRDGQIYQYVKIEDFSFCNGFTDKFKDGSRTDEKEWYRSKNKMINDIKYNLGMTSNNITTSIEHMSDDGTLTDEQFKASVWLHKYIIAYVKEIYDIEIKPDRNHIVRHFDFTGKDCPKAEFPWLKIIEELNKK